MTVSAFNNQIDNMLNEFTEIYSDNNVLMDAVRTIRIAIGTFRRINARKVVENIMHYIYPYKEHIMLGDDEFFLNHDYTKELEESKIGDSVLVDEIKKIYLSSTDENKEALKKYFKVLLILGSNALNLPLN
jgi:hypothetical protein